VQNSEEQRLKVGLEHRIKINGNADATRAHLTTRSVFTKTESSASLDRLGASRTGTKPRGLPP
jgi:hypothetical protein